MSEKLPIVENERVPTIDFLERAFNKLEESKEEDYDTIMKEFVDTFGSYPILPISIGNDVFLENFKTFRVISEKELELLKLDRTKVSSFSYPPKEIASQQRFNIKGFPVFYGASSLDTAIEEKLQGLKNGEIIYLSEWQLKKGIKMTYIMWFFGYKYDNAFKDLVDSLEQKMDKLFDIYSEDKREALKYLLTRLTTLSLKEPFNNITSALGHYYLYRSAEVIRPSIGFLAYPSRKKRRDGYNFAINPKLVQDGSLVCTSLKRIVLKNHSLDGSAISINEIGVLDGEKIKWKKFSYRLESATFLDKDSSNILGFEGDEINVYRFHSYKEDKSLTVKELIYENMQIDILKEVVCLANRKEEFVLKQYNCPVPENMVINETECKRIEFRIKFHYYEN